LSRRQQIMKLWAPHVEARALGPPHHRGQGMHLRQFSQTIPCISRTVEGQPGHSLLQASMPDDEELECAPSKRKFLNWTPRVPQLFRAHHGLLHIQSIQQGEGDSGLDFFQQLGLPIPHLLQFQHHTCT